MTRDKWGNGTEVTASQTVPTVRRRGFVPLRAGGPRFDIRQGAALWGLLGWALPVLLVGVLWAGHAAAQSPNDLGTTIETIGGHKYRVFTALNTTITLGNLGTDRLGFQNIDDAPDIGFSRFETFEYRGVTYTLSRVRLSRTNASGADDDYEALSVSFAPELPETAFRVKLTKSGEDTTGQFSETSAAGELVLGALTALSHNFGDGNGWDAATGDTFNLKLEITVNTVSNGNAIQQISLPTASARAKYDPDGDLSGGVFVRGEFVCIGIDFLGDVTVSAEGTPFIYLRAGGTRLTAMLRRNGVDDGGRDECTVDTSSATKKLRFRYRIRHGDLAQNTLELPRFCRRHALPGSLPGCTGSIELGGATLTDPRGLPVFLGLRTDGHTDVVPAFRIDARSPVVTDAEVDGSRIVLTFDDVLRTDDEGKPAKGRFRVLLGASAVTPSAFGVVGQAVGLGLPREAQAGERVVVRYTARVETPPANPRFVRRTLQDQHWNSVASFEIEARDVSLPNHLNSLDLSGMALRPQFSPEITQYQAVVDHAFPAFATLIWSAPEGVIVQVPMDADRSRDGLQVAIGQGETTVRVPVLNNDAADDSRRVYTIRVYRLPRLTLALDRSWITENGGTASVTGTAAAAMPVDFNLRIVPYRQTWTGVTEEDYTQSSSVMHFAKDATQSTAAVTITAVDNDYDNPDRLLVVTGHSPERGGDYTENLFIGGKHRLEIRDDDDVQDSNFALSATAGDDGSVTVQWSGDDAGVTDFRYRWREYYELVDDYEHDHDRWSEELRVSGSGVQSVTISEGLCVGTATTFEVWPTDSSLRRERVRVTPTLANTPVVRISAATTNNVEHSASIGDVAVSRSPTFSFVRSGDVARGLCRVQVRFHELGQTQRVSFAPGAETSEYYTVAIDRLDAPETLCSVTWEVLDGEHYDVRAPENRATVQVKGPGTTCAALYSGTMTVGVNSTGSGFVSTSNVNLGALAPRTFQVDGTTYRVHGLAHGSGRLRVLLDKEITQAFGVKMGTVRVTGLSYEASGNYWLYTAPMADPGWSANDSVAVELFPVTGAIQHAPVTGSAEAPEPLTASRPGPPVFQGSTKKCGAIRQPAVRLQPVCHRSSGPGTTARTSL